MCIGIDLPNDFAGFFFCFRAGFWKGAAYKLPDRVCVDVSPAPIRIPVTLKGRVFVHIRTFWRVTEDRAVWIQRKVILYPTVLGPVGQVFTLSCRMDMNFVVFIITLKSSFIAGPGSSCSA